VTTFSPLIFGETKLHETKAKYEKMPPIASQTKGKKWQCNNKNHARAYFKP
jgi:hypothetical protein